jgi:hypothetical protein
VNAEWRVNFPDAVFLNRLAAPRCVLIFGITSLLSCRLTIAGSPA